MGFDLDGLFAVDEGVLALFDRVIPGGARFALRTRRAGGRGGLPEGLLLPWPDTIGHALDGALREAAGWTAPEHEDEWRAAAGLPENDAFEDTFPARELRLVSLLSLAAPAGVVMVDDRTFGGFLVQEFAAVCVAGRLRAAEAIEHGGVREDGTRARALVDGRYETVAPGTVDPVARCAAVLHPAFTGAFLFDGYLPRDAYGALEGGRGPRPRPLPPLRVDERLRAEWSRFFPVLDALPGP